MFWRKKSFHEEIISQYGGKAAIIYSEDSQKKFEQLKEMIGILGLGAQMVNSRKADSLARKSLELLPKCMLASYHFGYFLKEVGGTFSSDDSDANMKKISNIIMEICLPLFESFNQLIELGQGPGSTMMLGGDTVQIKQNSITEIVGCATKYFNDGVFQSNRRP